MVRVLEVADEKEMSDQNFDILYLIKSELHRFAI